MIPHDMLELSNGAIINVARIDYISAPASNGVTRIVHMADQMYRISASDYETLIAHFRHCDSLRRREWEH